MQKPQALVYLTGQEVSGYAALRLVAERKLELPEGCTVDIETAAIDMLGQLAKVSKEDVLVYEYMSFRDAQGRRPSATELYGAGVGFKAVRENYGCWFRFVEQLGDLALTNDIPT